MALTFNADKTFSIVEQVAPPTEPAGYVPDGCTTTDTYLGTYAETEAETDAGTASVLTLTFTSGTANIVSGCNDAASDSPGQPLTTATIAAETAEGLIPGTTETYTVTHAGMTDGGAELVISPGIGLGPPSSTTLRM